MSTRAIASALGLALAITAACYAQWQRERESRGRGRPVGRLIRIEGGTVIDENAVRTARETVPHSSDTPHWTNAPGFEHDVFTFARVIFRSEQGYGGSGGFGRQLGWWVDYPDADLNLSYRLQQLTSIRSDPDARVLKLTDPEVLDYPLLYMEHAGYMVLSAEEVVALRQFFACGGSLFVNDFWSTEEWDGFAAQMARVLPGRAWTELDTDHPLFRCVFDLRRPMHHLRVPTMQFWNEDHDSADPESPLHRVFRGEGSETMHIRVLLDDAGRMQVLAIHNSDVSDGWEREGENQRYFSRYSEKTAYPLAINILFYLFTH
jgi:hypothetical protein